MPRDDQRPHPADAAAAHAPRGSDRRAWLVEQVTARVLDGSSLGDMAPTDSTPESLERLHEALTRFYDKCARDASYFRDADHGVGWVWATFRKLRELQEIHEASGPRLDPIDESDDVQAARLVTPGNALPGSQAGGDAPYSSHAYGPLAADDAFPDSDPPYAWPPCDVIVEYFSSPGAPTQGRLGLTPDSLRVVQWVASAALVPQGGRIPTALWAQIADELGRTNAAVRDLYKTAKLGFAVLYYVIGALGPPGAFRDVDTLAAAVEDFRRRFTGQREWSILKFAANCAVPQGDHAQVDPDLYNDAIRRNAPQARRLGWYTQTPETPAPETPGPERPARTSDPQQTPPPAVLLDAIEHQTAAMFGRAQPWCVLASEHANPGDQGVAR
jgi:hypothetical protein